MRLPLILLFRSLIWMAFGIILIAVGLGRYVPRPITVRDEADPRYYGVDGQFFADEDDRPRFLDRETGEFSRLEPGDNTALDHAVCSPWRDERGQFQMVSRWRDRIGKGGERLPRAFGLARYTFPEGRLIDQVVLDVIPVGKPCWVPGLSSRILFTSGDGMIYRYDFEDAVEGRENLSGNIEEHMQAHRLTWRTKPPGIGPVFIKDIIWPTDPKLGGRLIASVSIQEMRDGIMTYLGPQLWWLAISDDGTAIERIGRLTVPAGEGRSHDYGVEERLPSLALTPGGGLALAYLTRPNEAAPWELRIAPVELDDLTANPMVLRDRARGLALNCAVSAPAFSTDGRWVYGLLSQGDINIPLITARRFSVASALALVDPRGQDLGDRLVRAWELPRLVRSDLASFIGHGLLKERWSGMLEGKILSQITP